MHRLRVLLAAVALAIVAGGLACRRYLSSDSAANDSAPPAGDRRLAEDHEHQPGLHGGIIATLGREEYHTEAVIEPDGRLQLYTLGSDETRIHEVERQELTVYLKPKGGEESSITVLKPDPLPDDADGMTSRFVGTLPEPLVGQPMYVTIPGLRIGGERFFVRFESPGDTRHAAMPAGVGADEARQLYLTPGGLYTEADIEANGQMTAAEKYRGFRAQHDLNPQPGDMLCPITRTKANPACTWVIGGKSYEFCCPPCIDEFLTLAKEEPEKVLAPEDYVKH